MALIYRRIPSFLLHEPRKELGLKLPRKNKQWWHSPLFSGHVGRIGFPHNPFFHVKHRSRLKATWPCCHMCDSGTLYLTSSFYLFIGAPSFHTAVFVSSAAHSSTTADCVDTPTYSTSASGKPRLFSAEHPPMVSMNDMCLTKSQLQLSITTCFDLSTCIEKRNEYTLYMGLCHCIQLYH